MYFGSRTWSQHHVASYACVGDNCPDTCDDSAFRRATMRSLPIWTFSRFTQGGQIGTLFTMNINVFKICFPLEIKILLCVTE